MDHVQLSCKSHLVAEGGQLANACVSLEVVYTIALAETLDNKSSFETVDKSLLVRLDFEYEAAIDRFCSRWKLFEFVYIIGFEVC